MDAQSDPDAPVASLIPSQARGSPTPNTGQQPVQGLAEQPSTQGGAPTGGQGPADAPVSSLPAPAPPPPDSQTKEAVDKLISSIPYAGPLLLLIFKQYKAVGLLLFIAGFVLAAALYYFNVMPEKFAGDKYKKPVGTAPPIVTQPDKAPVTRTDPKTSGLTKVAEPPPWLKPILEGYRLDGAIKQRGYGTPKPGFEFDIQAVTERINNNTRDFKWTLRCDLKTVDFFGAAYRVTADGLVQPLVADAGSTESGSLAFKVPECNEGDTLLAVLSLAWNGELAARTLDGIIRANP
jgi:hypothetical protein